jgi:hypothetical protein
MTPRQQIESYLGLYKQTRVPHNRLRTWHRVAWQWAIFTLGALWGAAVAGALSTLW